MRWTLLRLLQVNTAEHNVVCVGLTATTGTRAIGQMRPSVAKCVNAPTNR